MREVKPKAYRPRRVYIGLLRPKNAEYDSRPENAEYGAGTSSNLGLNNKTKPKYIGAQNKKIDYLFAFEERVGPVVMEKIKETIQDEETNIRGSYEESTDWVSPESFVDHILKDSIFIMEFIKEQTKLTAEITKYTEDVKQDLLLLENQLPYFIFEKLFGPYKQALGVFEGTIEQFILKFFSLEGTKKTNFRHFTDMFRCVFEESLEETPQMNDLSAKIEKMENADNLSRAGVKFTTMNQLESSERDRFHRFHRFHLLFQKTEKTDRFHRGNQQPLESISIRKETADDYSLRVEFNKGCLVMSSFRAAEDFETILRNVIAFEQCHATVQLYTSNYISFLNFLITTERDVEVLTTEGVLRNNMGRPALVVEMVNSLNRGLKKPDSSQYHSIAMHLRDHCTSRRKRLWATLSKVYFSDLLTGTATCAAAFLLFLTLVGTVASVIQAYKSFK